MAHLIVTFATDSREKIYSIISSGFFDRIYVVMDTSNVQYYEAPEFKDGVKVTVLKLDYSKPTEEIVPELYVLLKKGFTEDKVQDLDMALNISSGTGKEHSVVISTLMKLGYGIRLIDLDKDGNILEMI